MSELHTLLSETTAHVLEDIRNTVFDHAWAQISDAGLTSVLVPEDDGGFGGGWEDALIVVKACGQYASPVPVPEHVLAGYLAKKAGLEPAEGALTISPHTDGTLAPGNVFTGTMQSVPWGRNAGQIAATVSDGAQTHLVIADRSRAQISENRNPAGEPRDTLRFEDATVLAKPLPGGDAQTLFALGAMLRTAQIAGAIAQALALSVNYARERQQFGRPLANFQAIQQQLAVLAEEAAAADMAAAAAFRAADRSQSAFSSAAAKLRANRAARTATGIAHQVHGAMGFTAEYDLHHFTRRLWAWQTEFGNERFWGGKIGAGVAARGPGNFWPDLVALTE